jgi:hypothetical protein
LDGSFAGGGRSAAIWFQIRKKLQVRLDERGTYKRKAIVMLTHVTCMEVTPGSRRIHCVTGDQPDLYRGYLLTAKMSSRNPHFKSHGATALLESE